MTHRVWLVDLDGTLYHALPVKLVSGLELALRRPHDLRRIAVFRREHERQRECSGEGDPFRAQLAGAARRLGLSVHTLECKVRWAMIERPCRWLRLFRRRSLLREMAAFRASGGRLALVSDYPARAKLAALRCGELFDVVVAAGESGGPVRLKPDPDGYLRAARSLGVAPADCVVLGDRPDADGAAAALAGMAFRRIG